MFKAIGNGALAAVHFVWRWSVPYNSRNRPIDAVYAAVWSTRLDQEGIRNILQEAFPTIPRDELPTEEEAIRRLVRERLSPGGSSSSSSSSSTFQDESDSASSDDSSVTQADKDEAAEKQKLLDAAEETWEHLPTNLRSLLASLNAQNLETKLTSLLAAPFHTPSGRRAIRRASSGVRRTLAMWRHGFRAAVPRTERVLTNVFILFLVFSACYPDVAAGVLGERSYNQRSIGGRIVTLCQLWFLWRYPQHSLWLLFNWSLERLLGAFVGSTAYALAAVVPAVHEAYGKTWFRGMMLALSMTWQVGVQFSPAVRDYVVRLVTRRQMRRLREHKGGEEEQAMDWDEADRAINAELMAIKVFAARDKAAAAGDGDDAEAVPVRVRVERYIQYTACYKLGRPADQLVGLLKDDLEGIVNTYEDYQSTSPTAAPSSDGHVEPRAPKFLLVAFDVAIFAYVCYSFYPQPFTFNTVVAYGTVVCVKQAIVACKRYQTPKSARRLFTNMVSINIIGVFLVSTPVTVDRHVLDSDFNFVALTLAMVLATLFLAETIAPLLLALVEGLTAGCGWLRRKMTGEKKSSGGEEKAKVQSAPAMPSNIQESRREEKEGQAFGP
ncbi:hypothetical protein ISF_05675 [Cordyceps fumosorosea ARSEF 2679]|uniref:Uncharacterized protein n=1 Tax=Cordyceps fumosorosea (strain ARSEF 2679) TaxID=1081104 RepID=A0A167TIM5_CORFA|nr:hypothetical protein ISF_05675 [Cordyceps fumosorosea ARSEF 2679]OAA60636.1 hypothetical protein ISF_05675 [Cordyceps fumosorosea ARSEF 2679]